MDNSPQNIRGYTDIFHSVEAGMTTKGSRIRNKEGATEAITPEARVRQPLIADNEHSIKSLRLAASTTAIRVHAATQP